MELEDLKSTWKSIENDIEQISITDEDKLHPRKKKDVKESLINRFYFEISAMSFGGIAIATSRIWAPMKMPVWWICAFCVLFITAIIATVSIVQKLRQIRLGESTHTQVLDSVLSVRRFYRNLELYSCSAILVLALCNLMIIPVANIIDLALIITLIAACSVLEFFWYRANIRRFNEMKKWFE